MDLLLTWIDEHGEALALVVPVVIMLLGSVCHALASVFARVQWFRAAAFAARAADFFDAIGPHLLSVLEALRGRGRAARSVPPPQGEDPDQTPRPGSGAASAGLVIWLLGCSNGPAIELAHRARDVSDVAGACLVELRPIAEERCAGDRACLDNVAARSRMAGALIDAFHETWCAVDPSAEGCDQ